MTAALTAPPKTAAATSPGEQEFITFYLGDLLLGIDIQHVQEINRNVDLTPVPHAPKAVRGVINPAARWSWWSICARCWAWRPRRSRAATGT